MIGIGAMPVTQLAESAGLTLDNGIAVDEFLRTSDPDIFAAGDCCSFPLAIYGGRRVRLESWRNAQDQGTLAARNMLGAGEPISAVPWFWSDQYDLTLQIAGLAEGATQSVRRDLGGRRLHPVPPGAGRTAACGKRHRAGQCGRQGHQAGGNADRPAGQARHGRPRLAGRQAEETAGGLSVIEGNKPMAGKRPTVADLRDMKGKRQLTMLRVTTLDEAAAAQAAGVDMLSVTPELMVDRRFRDAAPTASRCPGSEASVFSLKDDCLREAFRMMRAGADAIYCAASLETVRALRAEGVPVCGHSGLIPSHATWTGGFRAVGKTADTAMLVWEQVKALEEAGAFAAEIEVVPVDVATAISERTSLFMISMGAGRAATHNICSPRTFSAPIAATIPGTPKSTATSLPNTTGCRPSALAPSRNSCATSRRANIRPAVTP